MKKKTKFLAVASFLLTICLTGCNTQQTSVPDEPKKELKVPAVHDVKIVDRPDRTFTYQDGSTRKTDYKIIYNNTNSFIGKCASFLSKQFYAASGAEFLCQTESEYFKSGGAVTATSRLIILGCEDLFSNAKLVMPEKVNKTSGYYIKNVRHNYYIEAYDSYGYQEATLAFARYTVDYDMIEEDTIVFENKNIDTLPDMEVAEIPDYIGNTPTNNFTAEKRFGIGFDMTYPFMMTSRPDGAKGRNWHNIFDFIPESMFGNEHPYWYSKGAKTQACYSTRGDANEYKALVDQVAKVAIQSLKDNPTQNIMNITSNDIGDACGCEECLRLKEQDGASSGQVIRFMNDVNKIVREEMKKANRNYFLLFFAYLGYQTAPTVEVSVDPTLMCDDEIMVCIAPLHAKYTETFYDSVNEIYAQQFVNWGKYNKNIVAWLYETNYHHYMYPYNTYSTMMDNYRYCRENGAILILNEGQRFSANVPCFGHLKEYLCSKAQFDIYSNFNTYSDKFFRNYYLDASSIMREYFEEMIAWETRLENDPETGLGGGVYEEIGSKASYWPKQLLLNWLGKMDDAAKAVAKYEAIDSSLYKRLIKHINIERLFPMFCLADKHANTYTDAGILSLRKEFKALADELGLIEFAEHDGDISIKYKEWGID
ncbi:MAG: DUF4838 domain-containing protein [Bacilli bacterium]|nr:DUF4838 domain-containing protein [Bacilli bacterium]